MIESLISGCLGSFCTCITAWGISCHVMPCNTAAGVLLAAASLELCTAGTDRIGQHRLDSAGDVDFADPWHWSAGSVRLHMQLHPYCWRVHLHSTHCICRTDRVWIPQGVSFAPWHVRFVPALCPCHASFEAYRICCAILLYWCRIPLC